MTMKRPKRKRAKTRHVLQKKTRVAAVDRDFSSTVAAGSSHATCDLPPNTRIPCDVDSLELMNTVTGTGVTCNRKMTVEPADVSAPARIQNLLSQYDLVLECLADYKVYDSAMERAEERAEKNQPKALKLKVSRKHFGTCPLSLHPYLELKARDQRDAAEARVWLLTNPGETSIFARDAQNLSGATAWISRYWTFSSHEIKEFELVDTSCACRLDSHRINKEYRALVRVFQNDVYSLKVSIPPFKQFSESKKAERKTLGFGDVERSRSSSAKKLGEQEELSSETHVFNKKKGTDYTKVSVGSKEGESFHVLSESSGKKDKKDYYVDSESEVRSGGVPGLYSKSVKTELKDSTEEEASLTEKTERSTDVELILKKNGKELDFVGPIKRILQICTDVHKLIDDIKDAIPAVGVSFNFDMSLFQGTIDATWGNQSSALASGPSGRWIAVEPFYAVTFGLDVISVTASVIAGLDWTVKAGVELASVIVHAKISFDGKCHLGKTFTNDNSKEYAPLEMAARGRAELRAAASVLGHSLVDIGAGADTGVRFEGGAHISFSRCPEVEGKLSLLECKAAAWFCYNKTRTPVETTLWNEHKLWSGKLPCEESAAENNHAAAGGR